MNVIETAVKFWFTGPSGMLLYWLPLFFCLIVYTARSISDYRSDLVEREKFRRFKEKRESLPPEEIDDFITFEASKSEIYSFHYSPTLLIGTLIARIGQSIVPFVNVCYAFFDACPNLFKHLVEKLEEIFSQPLVPR